MRPYLVVAAIAACSLSARAQELIEPTESPYYWDRGEVRPFVSLAPAVGAVSGLDAVAGYGKPHWMWGGVEASALTTFDFGAVAGGPRLAFLIGDLSLKRRQTWAYSHGVLARQDSYDASDIEDGGGELAEYGAWDVSLGGVIPTPIGFGMYELAATFVDGVPEGKDLLEEWQRVVVRGNSIVVVRAGFAFWLLPEKLAGGALGEWLSAEGRGQTWRVGPFLDWTLTEHLSTTAVFTAPVSSPDDFGFWVGSWGILRLRYTWASGEPTPAFP